MRVLKKIFHRLAIIFNKSSFFVKYCEYSGIEIGKDCVFRDPRSTRIDVTRPSLISIGNRVDMNVNFQIWTHDWASHVFQGLYSESLNSSGRVLIGNNVYIAANVTILKGVKIGDNCIIGAGSVVSSSIPCNSVAVGNPCRVICSVSDYFEKRKKRCLNEAVDFVNSFVDRFGKDPEDKDLLEEWIFYSGSGSMVNFSSKQDFISFCKKKDGSCLQ